MRKLFVILGVPIDDLNMNETVDRLEGFVLHGRAFQKSHHIVTVNTDFVVKSQQDPELRSLLQTADLSTADGMPLVWSAHLLGVPLQERVAGADLVPALAARAASKGFSVYFLGAAPGIAEKAATILQTRFPELRVAGVQSPMYQVDEEIDPIVLEHIQAANPDILMVAFGNPKQEKFIQRYRHILNVPVMIGVGGSLDFIAGKTKRAPHWMQSTGLEWLHRLLQEPRRLFRRYLLDLFVFSTLFYQQWQAMRHGSRPDMGYFPKADLIHLSGAAFIFASGRLTIANYQAFRKALQEALAATPDVIVNLREVDFMDSSVIGTLVDATKRAREAGGDVKLASIRPAVLHTLSLLRLETFFSIRPNIETCLAEQVDKLTVNAWGIDQHKTTADIKMRSIKTRSVAEK
jgi:N-acetylglucosaminyldiphosphoundecaprenol N-acetyl-beta-D-mannosaminyltransferase